MLTCLLLLSAAVHGGSNLCAEEADEFRVWAVSCSHVTGVKLANLESLGEAIRQSEGRVQGAPEIGWDLMLSDRNDAPEPVGRGHSEARNTGRGGCPAGAVTRETFDWWKRQVLEHQDKIIVTMHHHMLRDTTTGSTRDEGAAGGYHNEPGAPGASYLYYIIENDDPDDFQYTADAHAFEDFLDEFYREHGRPAIDVWIGGHTHAWAPEDTGADGFPKKSITETRWGVTFVQIGALIPLNRAGPTFPMSRVLTFTDSSDALSLDVYMHTDRWKPSPKIGWYTEGAGHRVVKLRHPFHRPGP
jgi:hypothetical protein